jgi:Periplasmic molybdate-binding protein/domain
MKRVTGNDTSPESKKTLFAQIEPCWVLTGADGEEVDARLLMLLEAIQESGSLQQAAKMMGLSYRHAWTLVRPWTGAEGLLLLSRGQGSTLTEAGEALMAQVEKARARWHDEAARWQDLEIRLKTAPAQKIRILASHDLLLVDMQMLAEKKGVHLEINFCNSADALRALRKGGCDVAGFHMPSDSMQILHRYMATMLGDIPNLTTRSLFRYTQGLMLSRKNAQRIKNLNDLARRKISFVNRQRGSGTRLLFDALLSEAGIDPIRIIGYNNEEFTHHAVAATIAAGATEAGFGNEAAARFFKLAFVPLVEESYYLAWRNTATSREILPQLIGFLDSKFWQDKISKKSGYQGIKLQDSIIENPY